MPRRPKPAEPSFRNRIIDYRQVKASELVEHDRNWRTHPQEQQDAMRQVLGSIGWVDGVIARQLPDGSLQLVNGHLRRSLSGDELVPVLVTDLTEEETLQVLLTFDALSGLSESDPEALQQLINDVELDGDAVERLIGSLSADEELFQLAQGEEVNSVEEEWQDMPEFKQGDETPWKTLKVHFKSAKALAQFAKLLNREIGERLPSIWFPAQKAAKFADKRAVSES